MSSQYDYLNELASYNQGNSDENELTDFANMRNMSEQMLKDNLIEGLGLPASEFILDKSARGLASQIKNRFPTLKNNEFLDDVQENGLNDALANKLVGLKKVAEDKAGNIIEGINDKINNTIEDAKTTVDAVKSKVQIPDETINAFKDKFEGQNFTPDKINEMIETAKDPDTWHNTMRDNPEYNETEAENARNFVNQQSEKFDYPALRAQRDEEFMNQNRETLQMKGDIDNTDLEQSAAKNISGSDNAGIGDGESIPLKAIGENVAEDVGEDVGESVGLAADEGIGAALDSTGVLAPIGALIGLGGLIGSLFGIFDSHSAHAPPPPLVGRPSLDVGA
jgi:hypothetical protein